MVVVFGAVAVAALARNAPATSAVRLEKENALPAALAADTVSLSIHSGDVLITLLPATIESTPVQEYSGLRVPARSWLRGRAFFWQTSRADSGIHTLFFRGLLPGVEPDTLVVVVAVES